MTYTPSMVRRLDLGGRKAGQTTIDSADYSRVADFSWSVSGEGYVAAYIRGSRPKKWVYLHRLIMDAPTGTQVDHINNDRLDNRRANLRLVTNAQNMQNRKGADRDNPCGVRGVNWHKETQRYRAQLHINGKGIHLGLFERLEDAAKAAADGRRRYMTHAPENERVS